MKSRNPSFHRLFPLVALLAAFNYGLGCAEEVDEPDEDEDAECGNGAVEDGEGCDNGDANSDTAADACRQSCQPAACGDGVQDTGESCDDGNTVSGDGCSDACGPEYTCGNGTCEVLKGESCSACAQDCCTCGDGLCEVQNGESCSTCQSDCCSCGDGVCSALQGETCGLCASDCCPFCGNLSLDGAETCDDGNHVDGDGCSAACEDEDGQVTCGNGVLEWGEQCDDGDTTSGDGCSASCSLEFVCGDGFCDSGNGEACALCPQDCCPNCGNGAVDPGEDCDGANLNGLTCVGACYDGGSLFCTPDCQYNFTGCTGTLPTCGDGVAECNEICDGADLNGSTCDSLGYAGGTLACGATCTFNTSGCGALLGYLNENFDVQCPPAGWTFGGDWECGTPSLVGPAAAYSAPNCIATNISGNYSSSQSYATATVTTPNIDLTGAATPYLVMRSWLYTESSYDCYNLKISTDGGVTYTQVMTVNPPYNGNNGGETCWEGDQSALGWQQVTADLTGYAGTNVRLRLAFRSDTSVEYPGVYIDDMKVLDGVMPLTLAGGADAPSSVCADSSR